MKRLALALLLTALPVAAQTASPPTEAQVLAQAKSTTANAKIVIPANAGIQWRKETIAY